MEYAVEIATVTEQLIAAARRRSALGRVPAEIQHLLDAPWALIRRHPGLRQGGHNVAVYRPGPDGISVEVGVQVSRTFAATDDVVCSATPAGTVATTAHFGSYGALGDAHDAVQRWCDAHRRRRAGVCWEIYGDWHEDPARVRTDVLYLLA